jgi:hypothetical protein
MSEVCLLCGKEEFDDSKGCLLSRKYTDSAGDWSCVIGNKDTVEYKKQLCRSVIKRSIKRVISELRLNVKTELLSIKCKKNMWDGYTLRVNFVGGTYIYRTWEREDKYNYVLTRLNRQDITMYISDVKAFSDTSFFIESLKSEIERMTK